ncbi:hypothetical protein F3J20_05720 [Paraburkholderia sp. Cy-641]|uniref:hypothetical protein n=1 Tax=Paraburkholderia sp. Cy-641 TaxID=2608337 RepID=UPI00141DC838|nr:hypothetical protein [Paraburkholderia sp. Cy-641]NIF76900.1 hypothetical protein [Paraburkholderia sp. Cy-641]
MYIYEKSDFSFDSWLIWGRKQLTREEQDEIKEVLRIAHEDFVKWFDPDSWTTNCADMHQLRHLLRSTDHTLLIHIMSNHEVARAVHEKLRSGQLIFIPPREAVGRYIENTRRRREQVMGRGRSAVPEEQAVALSISRAVTSYGNASRGPVAPSPVADFMANEAGENVGKLVGMSPGLQADLKKLGDAGWQIEYVDPRYGSFTNRDRQVINLDRSLQGHPVKYLQILSHEVGHAMYPYQEDLSSKVAYVSGTLEDEAAATMSNIRTQREILANHGPDIGIAGANTAAYDAAYNTFMQDGNAAACRKKIGAEFGNEITSNTGQSYTDYYGSWYDQTHPSR